MQLNSLDDLFVGELKDLYSAEKQLLKAIPKMAKAANSKALQNGFTKHLKQTEGHVSRLEKVFEELGVSPRGKKCKAMEGLIEEGQEVIDEDADPQRQRCGADRGRSAGRALRNGRLRLRSHVRQPAESQEGGHALAANAERRRRYRQVAHEIGRADQRCGRSSPTAKRQRTAKRPANKSLTSKVREAVGL